MKKEEIRIVRRRLDDYLSYKYLAEEADRKALVTQVRIEELGHPRSPDWDKVAPTETKRALSSKMNALISDQLEYEAEASEYHSKMAAIVKYLTSCYSGEARRLMVQHYIHGVRYEDLQTDSATTGHGIVMAITRAMQEASFSEATSLLG